MDTVADFLAAVFGDQDAGILITGRISGRKDGRNIDIPEYWNWPEQLDEIAAWADRHEKEDLYFSPMLYNRRQRIKEAVIYTPVVWADADTASPDGYVLAPSITQETSPGRYQVFWALTEPVAPEWAEAISRKVTYSARERGSDIGGWALTKYMRLPGGKNNKPEVVTACGGPWEVTVKYDGAVYTPMQMEEAFGKTSIPSAVGLDMPLPNDLPDKAVCLAKLPPNADIERALTMTPTTRSWNETLWWLECELFRQGLKPTEVFVLVNGCACDKYHRDNRPEQHLWEEILRAEHQVVTSGAVYAPDNAVERVEIIEPPVELLTEEERKQIPRTFVDDYVEWAAGRTNGSIAYQECGALTVLSTVLSDFGHAVPKFGNLGLNLWFMIVGVTTRTYKSTSKNLMLELLRPLEGSEYQYDLGSDASPEGLLTELSKHPFRSVLFHRDEAHGMISGAKGGKQYLHGFNEMLTELYDGWARGRLRSTGKEKKIEAVPVRFNLFLLGVPDKLGRTLSREDFASGFMARFAYAIGQPDFSQQNSLEQADVDNDVRVDDGLVQLQNKVLKMRAYWARETTPGNTMSIRVDDVAWDRLNTCIKDLDELALSSDMPEVMLPCADRLNKMVLKVACLLAMAERKHIVTLEYMLAAISFAERWYSTVVTMTRIVGRSEFSGQVDDLVRYIQGKGGQVRITIARRAFSTVEPRRWDDILKAAIDQQLIVQKKESGVTYLVSWND